MIKSVGSKKGLIVLQCEDCGQIRETRRNSAILEKLEHPCRACSNKRNGVAKSGKYSAWNSGNKKPMSERSTGGQYVNHSGYLEMYVGPDSVKYGRKDGYVLVHRKVAQDTIGRKLLPSEIVHHIDGDKTNNVPDNLLVCKSISEHREIHNALERVSFELVKRGILIFDKDTKIYKAPLLGDEQVELREFREHLKP